MCAGIAIRQWSVALLGQLFTIDVRVHPDQTVVERGPYRWVRHPSYLHRADHELRRHQVGVGELGSASSAGHGADRWFVVTLFDVG